MEADMLKHNWKTRTLDNFRIKSDHSVMVLGSMFVLKLVGSIREYCAVNECEKKEMNYIGGNKCQHRWNVFVEIEWVWSSLSQ